MLTQERCKLSKIVKDGSFAQVNLYRFQNDSLGKLFCTWFLFGVSLKIVEDDNAQLLAGTNSTLHRNSPLISTRYFNAVKLCLLTIKIDLYTGKFAKKVFVMISNDQI